MKKFLMLAFVAVAAMLGCTNSGAKGYGAVVELDDDAAYRPDTKVEAPTILDFNATWCGPCKMFAPVFHAAAEKYKDVKFVSIDVDKNPETAIAYGIQAIPTVIFINPDGTQTRFVGTDELLPLETFDKIVQELLK